MPLTLAVVVPAGRSSTSKPASDSAVTVASPLPVARSNPPTPSNLPQGRRSNRAPSLPTQPTGADVNTPESPSKPTPDKLSKILGTVRLLIAKADSTDSPHEADAHRERADT